MHVDGRPRGRPVVVLHGITRSAECWGWLVDAIGERSPVLRPDARGHGGSDHRPGEYALRHYVSDAVDVLEKVADRSAVLVGHSLGGVVAAAVAQQRPDLVDGVLLLDPALQLGEPWPDPSVRPAGALVDTMQLQRTQVPEARAEGRTVAAHAEVVAARPSGFGDTVGERCLPDVVTHRASAELACDLSVLDVVLAPPPHHLGEGWDPDRGIAVPGVVLAADRAAPDRVTRRRDAERLAVTSPRVRWQEVPGAGHDLQDEPANRPLVVEALHQLLLDVKG